VSEVQEESIIAAGSGLIEWEQLRGVEEKLFSSCRSVGELQGRACPLLQCIGG